MLFQIDDDTRRNILIEFKGGGISISKLEKMNDVEIETWLKQRREITKAALSYP